MVSDVLASTHFHVTFTNKQHKEDRFTRTLHNFQVHILIFIRNDHLCSVNHTHLNFYLHNKNSVQNMFYVKIMLIVAE